MELKGTSALITGGATRLGRAIAQELADAGVNILCVYHNNKAGATSLQKIITRKGLRCELLSIDLSRTGATEKVVTFMDKIFGVVDILINNSAIFYPTPLEVVSEADWDAFYNLNLKSAFFLSRAIGLRMRQKGNGRIVNIGDAGYQSPWPDYLPYALTKYGVNGMTIGLAKALAPEVLVNCVNPGPVLIPENYTPAEREKAIARTLLKREGAPQDIARTVRFFVESDYITAALLPVDGGRHVG